MLALCLYKCVYEGMLKSSQFDLLLKIWPNIILSGNSFLVGLRIFQLPPPHLVLLLYFNLFILLTVWKSERMSWHLSKYNSQPGLPINGLILLMNSQGHVLNSDLESSFGIPRKFFLCYLTNPKIGATKWMNW